MLEPGIYEHKGGEFVRTGDPSKLVRYHSTNLPRGSIINKFDTEHGAWDEGVIYSSYNPVVSMIYSRLHGNTNGEDQIYVLEISPNTVVKATGYSSPNAAMDAGADIIEVPTYEGDWETRILNPDIITIKNVYQFDNDNPHLPLKKLTNNLTSKGDLLLNDAIPVWKDTMMKSLSSVSYDKWVKNLNQFHRLDSDIDFGGISPTTKLNFSGVPTLDMDKSLMDDIRKYDDKYIDYSQPMGYRGHQPTLNYHRRAGRGQFGR